MFVESIHDTTHSDVYHAAKGGSYHHHHNTGDPFAWASPELVHHVQNELNFYGHDQYVYKTK